MWMSSQSVKAKNEKKKCSKDNADLLEELKPTNTGIIRPLGTYKTFRLNETLIKKR